MIDNLIADWTCGISKQLRELIHAGADDDQLNRLILARKCGDDRLMASVINEVAAPRHSKRPAYNDVQAGALSRLQCQALSLVVNDLSSAKLYAFISWLQPISEALQDKYRCEAFWTHQPALAVIAKALCDDVLSRIESTADIGLGQSERPKESR